MSSLSLSGAPKKQKKGDILDGIMEQMEVGQEDGEWIASVSHLKHQYQRKSSSGTPFISIMTAS